MTISDMTPVLYIIMRADLESLNPGKAMAQASHVYGALLATLNRLDEKWNTSYKKDLFYQWQTQTPQLFGTTIVLTARDWDEINAILLTYEAMDNVRPRIVTGVVHDPTYPIRDGTFTHYVPLYTCGFVFGRAADARKYLNDLPLHP